MTRGSLPHGTLKPLLSVLLVSLLWVSAGTAEEPKAGKDIRNEIIDKDLKIEFTLSPNQGGEITEGGYATLAFRITDATTGTPISGANPAAWIDLQGDARGKDCKEKVSVYLRGMVGLRPVIDLNSYFILVMNRDPSISVIDPLVGITGKTSLYASIPLTRAGADWVKDLDQNMLYVTMPSADKVAVIDLEKFKVIGHIEPGENPFRILIQPDQKYLWIGTNGRDGKPGGVTVVDVASHKVVARIPTGRGHHEIVFSADSTLAYVTSREDGIVSVIDIQQLKKIKDIAAGPLPISMAFSPLSQAVYIADGKAGTVTAVESRNNEVTARIQLKPGLGPQLVTPDGRWLLIVNSAEDGVHVIDTSTNQLVRTIPVGDEPYQMTLTREFVYVRCLGTERVSMIALPDIQKNKEPIVHVFSAGSKPPKEAGMLGIAAAISVTSEEHSVLVVNPNDGNIDYYMEGMNTPMGSFRNYGHVPMAVEIADRSLAEVRPGDYTTTIRIPPAGKYDVSLMLRSPTIVHCFEMTSNPDPLVKRNLPSVAVEYLVKERSIKTGDVLPLRFRLTDPATGGAKTGLQDIRIVYFLAPGKLRKEVAADEVESGLYEAQLPIAESGAYYFYVLAPSLNVRPEELTYLTLHVVKDGDRPSDRRRSMR